MGSQFQQHQNIIVTRVIMIPFAAASAILDDERRYRHYLLNISGIVDIHFQETGEIEVSYDVRQIEYDEILLHLEKIGLPISYSLWEHLKSAWFQYTDTAARTASTPKGVSNKFKQQESRQNGPRDSNKH